MKISTNSTIKDTAFFSKNMGSLYTDRKASLKNEKLDNLFGDLETKRVKLGELTSKESNSASLDKADSECDTQIRLLFTYTEGLCASPFAEEAAQSEKINAVLKTFGRAITGERYAVQYSKTDDMLKRLDALSAEIEALRGMKERIEGVRNAAEAFSALAKTTTQTSAAATEKAAYLVKKEIIALVNNDILPYLSALSVIEEEKYKPFLAEIEKEIERANAAVKQSKPVSQKEKTAQA